MLRLWWEETTNGEGGARGIASGGIPTYLPTYLPLAYAQRDPFRRVHYRTTTRETSEYALLRDMPRKSCFFFFLHVGDGVCIA
jgi:hypothetical protein